MPQVFGRVHGKRGCCWFSCLQEPHSQAEGLVCAPVPASGAAECCRAWAPAARAVKGDCALGLLGSPPPVVGVSGDDSAAEMPHMCAVVPS